MHVAPHRAFFNRPGEPGCGAVLSTGVYSCSWFSFGFAVWVSLLAAHLCFVWTSNGKPLICIVRLAVPAGFNERMSGDS